MYAVFQHGSKQYRVQEGETVRLEKLDVPTGQFINFNEILMINCGKNVKLGYPFVSGAKINAKIIAHGRSKKIHIVKFRRRKHYHKQQGHRQWFTDIKINSININEIERIN
ncbi:50S ribosomal protein L21 [Candidatus Ecksteinia adelgidicola]|nr:50S ribosomal protein L21 [Candidatus Ecksteinia adelgidicola]